MGANKPVGLILSPLCSMWPFGDFPFKSAWQAKKVLDPIFKENGVLAQVQSLSKNRTNSHDAKFCWRREYARELLVSGSKKECPSPISSKEDLDRLEDDDADKVKHGMWTCKSLQDSGKCSCRKKPCVTTGNKPCVFPFVFHGKTYTSCTTKRHHKPWCATRTDSSGKFMSWNWDNCNMDACDETTYAPHAGGCRTARRGYGKFTQSTRPKGACEEACSKDPACVAYEFGDPDKCEIHWYPITHGAGGNSVYTCYIKGGTRQEHVKTREEISAVPYGCDMTSGRKCYDKCPPGSRPLPITGGFRPLCQTKCSESDHHVDCGFGCANEAWSCVNAVVEQIGSVVKAVSRLASIATGLPNVFDAVVSIVEFIITTLPKLIEFFENAWNKLTGKLQTGEKQVGLILTMVELAKEANSSFIGPFLQMHESVKQVPSMFKELLDAEWGWLNLDKIPSILEKFRASDILLGFKMVEAFKKPKCKVADRTPVFTITDIGDARFVGKWMRQGSRLDRPRYRLIDDSMDPYTPTIYWSKKKCWRAFVDNPGHWGRHTLYTNGNQSQTVPSNGWEVVGGVKPAPTLQIAP